jgi:hypothetical protein
MDGAAFSIPNKGFVTFDGITFRRIHIDALESAGLVFSRPTLHDGREVMRTCFVTPEGYALVDRSFVASPSISAITIPVEITDSLKAFQQDHPQYAATCFLMMRFGKTELHEGILASIRAAVDPYDIVVLRADDKEYHEDVYFNILTYIFGCAFGVAVFERIEQEDFNPNVSLEVGFMFGLRKKVCLLKDKTLKALHTDLVGKLYKPFDPINPAGDIRRHMKDWLIDKGIIIIPRA